MNTTDQVHFLPINAPPHQAAARPTLAPSRHELAAPVRVSILRGRTELIGAQRLDGSWAAATGIDYHSYSLLLLLDVYLEREPSAYAEQGVATIFREQRPSGGWSLARDGAFDLDSSVLTYFALKLAGESASRPELVRARNAIRAQGGADNCSATIRMWLAVLGQIDYEVCPPIAPEWLLMPGCTENLSAAAASLLAAQAAIWATRPTREVSLARGIRELFIEPPQNWRPAASPSANQPFSTFAGFWRGCERLGWLPLRRRALERADFLLSEATMEHATADIRCDDLVWRRIALDALGHAKNGRVVDACQRLLDRFAGCESDDARSRPRTNLTSDTALAIEALRASGTGADDEPIAAAIDWLLCHRLDAARSQRQATELAALVRVGGCLVGDDDSNTNAMPPDIKLAEDGRNTRARHGSRPSMEFARFTDKLLGDAVSWQQMDGGWTFADDRLDRRRLQGILRASVRRTPGMSDVESTGMMLDFLARLPRTGCRPSTDRGAAFLRSSQRGDGSWLRRDGAPSIAATAWAVQGLIAAGVDPGDMAIAAGINWILIHQQSSGGWCEPGERRTVNECFADAEFDITETAVAVLALVRSGHVDDEATRRGIDALVNFDATDERDLYATGWKLIALARWAEAIARLNGCDEQVSLKLVCSDFSI